MFSSRRSETMEICCLFSFSCIRHPRLYLRSIYVCKTLNTMLFLMLVFRSLLFAESLNTLIRWDKLLGFQKVCYPSCIQDPLAVLSAFIDVEYNTKHCSNSGQLYIWIDTGHRTHFSGLFCCREWFFPFLCCWCNDSCI